MVLNKRDLERAFSPKVKHKKPVRGGVEINGAKATTSSRSKIKVFVRVRPLSEREQAQNVKNTISVIDDKMLIFDPKEEAQGFFFHGVKQKARDIAKRPNKEKQFIFDQVFDSRATNMEVYEGSTKGIITTLLEGYNCSVFVYGATGAGKTHTMLGNAVNPGITVLTMNELFDQIEQLKATKNVEIGITYLEVYNENVQDLINPCGPMHLRDDSNGGVVVAGMAVETITSSERLFQLLQQGNLNRTQHPTDANAESSRSHAVFQVYLRMQTKASGELKYCKLSMIDLAGSERGSATGCVGARFKEGSNINKSLLALGNCINNLADGLRHIPYRDSKLTRILKDSLGGNCQTVMIANVSPAVGAYEDTYNTLKYATRAKSIKSQLTKNVMSVNLRVEHYVKMCDELKKEVASLKEQIKAMTTECANPVHVERLNELYKEKKQIHTEWLNLEAQHKLLQWRIRCKTVTVNNLKTQIAQHGTSEDQDLEKDEMSLSQLEARANCIVEKMSELLLRKQKHSEEYNKFLEEIKNAKITKIVQGELKAQCELAEMQIQTAHHQKIIKMQDKRIKFLQAANDKVANICNDYHMLLRGRSLITNTMEAEYRVGVKKMKDSKVVTWMDIEESDDEEGVRPFTNLSLDNLQSSTLTVTLPEFKSRSHLGLSQEFGVRTDSKSQNKQTKLDLDSTFVMESTESELPFSKKTKASFVFPKVQTRTAGTSSTSALHRKFTPARGKVKGLNKENNIQKIKIGLKSECVTPARPKTALSSVHVNIQETKTPDTKVPLSGCKMSREKERKQRLTHPYNRPVKLKRLGANIGSVTKTQRL